MATSAAFNQSSVQPLALVQDHRLGGRRILLVEDDYYIAFDLREELISLGAEVTGPVGDLDLARKLSSCCGRLDAAVIDINIHGEFSYHLVDELVKRDVPVLFSSGYDRDVLPFRLRHLDFYSKPTPARQIALRVADLITERQRRND